MEEFKTYSSGREDLKVPLFIFHHGAGQSGLCFHFLRAELELLIPCRTVSFDCRGHGKTSTADDSDLSLDTLATDLSQIIEVNRRNSSNKKSNTSMGAAVVVHLLSRQAVSGVLGFVVLDVVEGTALESLVHMKSIINARPVSFESEKEAIDWATSSNQVKNRESAEISIPSQLVLKEGRYHWRTNLTATQSYWREWYTGMSDKFLSIKTAKLLILAGTDRLDKPLTIGQMQGKFQMEVMVESGHYVHEDVPAKLATILANFRNRNQPLDLSKLIKR